MDANSLQSGSVLDVIQHTEIKNLGKTVIVNVPDAIVVRERLSNSELNEIQIIIRKATCGDYFTLGETGYKRIN